MGTVASKRDEESAEETTKSPQTDRSASDKQPQNDEKEEMKEEDLDRQITGFVVGCGNRGSGYATFAITYPKRLKIVGIADPSEKARERMKELHDIPDEMVFDDWQQALELARNNGKFCDFVIVATPDRLHEEPAVAFANLKFDILLEKPMAVTIEGCRRIAEACDRNEVILAVCHVLRYTFCNKKIKELIDSGVIGDIVNIQHLEPVGYLHFAHSYVRGNWRNEAGSTFSLMAKSCHDIDLIAYWMGCKCTKVSSFGDLKHFKPENKPQEAGDATECLNCGFERDCPYSAVKAYIDPGHFSRYVTEERGMIDIEELTQILQKSPYSRCVYHSDNDVADHQVVNMSFENGATASFTMIAFTEKLCVRSTRVFGTLGELDCDDGMNVRHYDFNTNKAIIHKPEDEILPSGLRNHGGADYHLMNTFVRAVARQDHSLISTGATDSRDSHLLVFDAERSRRENVVVNIEQI